MSHPLQQRLARVRHHAWRLVVLHGLSWVVVAVLTTVFLLSATDYLVRFQDRGLRVISTLVLLAVLAGACYRHLYQVLSVRLGDAALARRLGRCFPQLGDGLVSAVEFLGQQDDDPTLGSVALRRAVVTRTTAKTENVDFGRALRRGPTVRAATVALGAGLAALVLLVTAPSASRIALARLTNPFNNVAWPQSTHLAIVDDDRAPPQRLARGDTFEVALLPVDRDKLPGDLYIRYRFKQGGGSTEETRVTRPQGRSRATRRAEVSRPFAYRFERDGRPLTGWTGVALFDPAAGAPLSGEPPPARLPRVMVARPLAAAESRQDSPPEPLLAVSPEARIERIARGQAFEVRVIDARGARLPSHVRIHYRIEDPQQGTLEESRLMQPAGRLVRARREDVSRSFAYRITGGDDRSMPWIPVEVIDPPGLDTVTAELTPPQYTGRPPRASDPSIRSLVGTRVRLSATADRPLASARLCFDDGRQLPCRIAAGDRRKVKAEFVVDRSTTYWFDLADGVGIHGGTGQRWQVRAVEDQPPVVSIDRPKSNLYVTPEAVVPLAITARDDLAVSRIELVFRRGDRPHDSHSVRRVYTRPTPPQPAPGGAADEPAGGDVRTVEHSWALAEMGLEAGALVTLRATATDFRPGTGTSQSRQVRIITPEELAERIAHRQALILSELSRVLELQRQCRQQVAALQIRLKEIGRLDRADLDRLRGTQLNQQQVERTLTSRGEGVPMHILGLLADLENNRIESEDVRRQMQFILDELARLEADHLPPLAGDLTAATKAAQVRLEDAGAQHDAASPEANQKAPPPPDATVAQPLARAAAHQDEVIATLQRLLGHLAQWENYRRFHRDVAQLLRRQKELAGQTAELARTTLAKQLRDLSPQESAQAKIHAGSQLELARSLDRLQQAMSEAAGKLAESDPPAAETVADAVDLSGRLKLSDEMRSAADAIRANRMGRSIDQQQRIVEGLEQMLDVLTSRREHELTRLVGKLRQAEAELGKLAARQEEIGRQMQSAGQAKEPDQQRRKLEELRRPQEQLREEAQRMARQLERLSANSPAGLTRQAGDQMKRAAQGAHQGDAKTASTRADQAKQNLQQARRELADRRRQAEVELAMEQFAQMEDAVKGLRTRQQRILDETRRLAKATPPGGSLAADELATLADLAAEQRLLGTATQELARKTTGFEVVRMTLGGAAQQMDLAGRRLEQGQADPPTEQAQAAALERLDQLLEALKQEPPEPSDSENANAGQGGQGQNQPADSPLEALKVLTELKLLKMMQGDLNGQTRRLEKDYGSLDQLPQQARDRYNDISRQQGRLAELLLGLIAPAAEAQPNLPTLPDPDHLDNDLPKSPLDEE